MDSRRARLTGWGRTEWAECEVATPQGDGEVSAVVRSTLARGVIARGCGRSYGDVSTNHGGRVIDMTALDAVEEFDPGSGRLVCQAGITLGTLVDRFMPQGFVPAVCPGTGFVTVGGAIAHDVHGKNHHLQGSIADHLEWFDLALPSGEMVRVAEAIDLELFRATVGGAGLTGVITRAALRLLPVASNAVIVTERRVNGLDQFMDELQAESRDSVHVVGWIDALARGSHLGRGIFIAGNPADRPLPVRRRIPVPVPFEFPSFTLNRFTMSAFNAVYLRRVRGERVQEVEFSRFVFPLDALLHWHRLYGYRGVYQFQCVIPYEGARSGIREILNRVAEEGAASPLAVLKTFGKQGKGYLSFPRPGFTLALDFPKTNRTLELIRRLYQVTVDHGGRTYLAKDACLEASLLPRMYPELDAYKAVLRRVDPEGRMQSDLGRRLGLCQRADVDSG